MKNIKAAVNCRLERRTEGHRFLERRVIVLFDQTHSFGNRFVRVLRARYWENHPRDQIICDDSAQHNSGFSAMQGLLRRTG